MVDQYFARRRLSLRSVAGLSASLSALFACAGPVYKTSESSAISRSVESPAVVARLDARVPELLRKYEVASVGVALIQEGRVTLARVYGEQAPGVPATSATLFGLASLTKPISAEALLRMASSGVLSLDEPMAPYWVDPDVANDPRHLRLTTRIALAHQTGLPNWRGHAPGGRLAFTFEPGTAFGYSGEGYDYAAHYAEKRLGQSFESLTQKYVFAPVGMTSSSFSARDWMRGRLAVPLDSAGRWGAPQVEDSGKWNAGNNLITTVGDYAAFVVSVMNHDGLKPTLASERLQPAAGPQRPRQKPCAVAPPAVCPRAVAMALGWMRLDYDSGPILMHTGSNSRPGGEQTIAWFEPQRRRGVVVLTSGRNGRQLYLDILDLLAPESPVPAFLRQSE